MPAVTLPRKHPQRMALHNEIHARPPEALQALPGAMNRRQGLQLRLQSAVEGLAVWWSMRRLRRQGART